MLEAQNRKHFKKLYNTSKGDKIVQFFEEFEAWNDKLGRDEEARTSALMQCLSRTTRQIYQDLTELVPQSYLAIKEDLIASQQRPNTTIWKTPPRTNTESPHKDDTNVSKTDSAPPPNSRKSVTFKIGPPHYIGESTNQETSEQTWIDPLGTRTTPDTETTNIQPQDIKWESSYDEKEHQPTRHRMTETDTTNTITNTHQNIGTKTTSTWHNYDKDDRSTYTPTAPYRPHTPYCTYCFKKGHSYLTCRFKLGYTPNNRLGQDNRGHSQQRTLQKGHWNKGNISEQTPATPTKDTYNTPITTLHQHSHTNTQSIIDKTYTRTKETLSSLIDRLANSQQRTAMMPISILIMAGIGALLGQTITSLATGSGHIISALGTGMRSTCNDLRDMNGPTWRTIRNATRNIISTGTTGISIIADTTGGPNGIILYSLIAILYIYLIYDKKKGNPRPPRER